MTKASKKKSSGSKYAVLILTAVIAIVAIGCGLFYATSNSKKDVLDKKGDEPQTVSLLDESIEAQRLLDNILLQKNNWQLIENDHGKKDVEVEEQKRLKSERMSFQMMTTLAATIDAKDPYTNGHSSRVSMYAREIAKRAGYDEAFQQNVYFVALLHDIGKIGIPDRILEKPGRLTDEEYEVIKLHTTIGAEILSDITEIPKVTIGARYHHERFDGNGYPDGLSGTDIPIEARIIGVADAYDAMSRCSSW